MVGIRNPVKRGSWNPESNARNTKSKAWNPESTGVDLESTFGDSEFSGRNPEYDSALDSFTQVDP